MKLLGVCACLAAGLLVSCGGVAPIVVGSNDTTEQLILGEIISQHLETRLSQPVQRRLGMGSSEVLFPAMQNGQVSVFPDYTGDLIAGVLGEQPATDPRIVFERARGEMARLSSMDVLDPLGFDARPVIVVRDADAGGIYSISEATASEEGWKLGVGRGFQANENGLPRLNQYRLPLAAPTRAVSDAELFPLADEGDFTMLAVPYTSGWLRSDEWRLLADDQVVFVPEEAVIVVRQEAYTTYPQLGDALKELSGKISAEQMRSMNAAVDLDERTPADVASEFLANAGLR